MRCVQRRCERVRGISAKCSQDLPNAAIERFNNNVLSAVEILAFPIERECRRRSTRQVDGALYRFTTTDSGVEAQATPVTVVSHGFSEPAPRRFQAMFDWTGTSDPTPWLCIDRAIEFMGGLVPGGWPEVRARNRELALRARDILCSALGVPPP